MVPSNKSGPADPPAGPTGPDLTQPLSHLAPAGSRRARTGWILALVTTLSASVAPPIARVAMDTGLNPTQILFFRLWLTALLMSVTLALVDHKLLIPRRWVMIAIFTGLVNSIGSMAYFWALTRLDVSVASMLFSVSPLLTLSVLALRGEPVTRRHLVRLVLALAGVYLLIGPGGRVDLIGVLLIVVSALAVTVQIVAVQYNLRSYNVQAVTFYISLGMALGITIFWLLQGMPFVEPTVGGWVAILTLALVSTWLARLALFGAVARIGGAQVALFTPFEIMLTVVWSVVFLGERLALVQWLGGVLVLLSALLSIERLGRVRNPLRWRLWPLR